MKNTFELTLILRKKATLDKCKLCEKIMDDASDELKLILRAS